MPVGRSETPLDIGGRQACEGVEEPGPDRARGAVLVDIFIGNSRQPGVVARPLRHPSIGGADPGSLAVCPTAFFVSRHADSPAQINAGAASSSRGSKETQLCVLRAADRSCRAYGHDPETEPAAAPRLRRN